MTRRVRVKVRGHVQGVGFRYAMRLEAERVGVGGWVRNRSDGSVEAEVEGASDQVDEVLAWLAQGPPGATVDDHEVEECAPVGTRRFEVR